MRAVLPILGWTLASLAIVVAVLVGVVDGGVRGIIWDQPWWFLAAIVPVVGAQAIA